MRFQKFFLPETSDSATFDPETEKSWIPGVSLWKAESIVLLLALFSLIPITNLENHSLLSVGSYFLVLTVLILMAFLASKRSGVEPAESRHQSPRKLDMALAQDLLLILTATGMWISTLLAPDADLRSTALWTSGIFLAVYAHRRYNVGFSFPTLLLGATLIVALNLGIAPFQLTGSDLRVQDMVGGGGARISRAVGMFWTANILGLWLVLFLPLLGFAAYRFFRDRRFWAASLYGALTLGSLLLLLRNLSRLSLMAGALVFVFSSLILLLRRLRPQYRKWVIGAAILMVIAAPVLLWVASVKTQADHRYTRVLQAKIRDTEHALSFRLDLQRRAATQIPEHLLLGVGYGDNANLMPSVGEVTDTLAPEVRQRYLAARKQSYAPHHLGLMLALDAGLIACLCFFGALALALGRYARRGLAWALDTHALAASVLGWTFLGLGYNVAYTPEGWPLGLLLFGAFLGSMRRTS